MNPLEDFLMEKTALFGDSAKTGLGHVGSAALGAAAAGAGSALFAVGSTAAGKIYDAATSKRDFRKMLEWHADLGQEDPRLVSQAFRTLRQFAPDMSRDPLVSGALVRHIVAAPQGAAGIVQEAMQGQRNIGHPSRDAFLMGAQSGMGEGMKGFAPFVKYPPNKGPEFRGSGSREAQRDTGPRDWSQGAHMGLGSRPMPQRKETESKGRASQAKGLGLQFPEKE
jgi:hypothetical protein